jgi:hypothetical protein
VGVTSPSSIGSSPYPIVPEFEEFLLVGFKGIFDPFFDFLFQGYEFMFPNVNRGTNHPLAPNIGD